jgi:hypothetical protein
LQLARIWGGGSKDHEALIEPVHEYRSPFGEQIAEAIVKAGNDFDFSRHEGSSCQLFNLSISAGSAVAVVTRSSDYIQTKQEHR